MDATSPRLSFAKAVDVEIAAAEAFRIETIREAPHCAKESALAHTAAGKRVTAEVRRLEKVADNFFQEAKRQRKEAYLMRRGLRHAAAAKPEQKAVAPESDKSNER